MGGGAIARTLATRCFAFHAKVLAARCGSDAGEPKAGCPSATEMCAALPLHINHDTTLGTYAKWGRCSLALVGASKSHYTSDSNQAAAICRQLPVHMQVRWEDAKQVNTYAEGDAGRVVA